MVVAVGDETGVDGGKDEDEVADDNVDDGRNGMVDEDDGEELALPFSSFD